MGAFRLLIVDDHSLFRRGLVALLSLDGRFLVVGEAADANEAQRLARQLQPDLILLDNHMPGVTGVDAIAGLRECAPQAKVLMLTVSESGDDLSAALRAGAHGYLLKTIDSQALAAALLRCLRGESVVSAEMTGKLVDAFQALQASPGGVAAPASPADNLSPREREILACLARAASNKEIARELGIAETTVKIHVQHILRKLDMSSRVQAAVFASEHGLV